MSLKIIYKSEKAISRDQDDAMRQRERQVMNEIRELFRQRAAKKYGVKYIPKNKNNEAV